MKYYAGFDVSTQQVKLVILNETGELIHSIAVNYESDLKTPLSINKETGEVCQKHSTWTKAIELATVKLAETGFDLTTVVAISGAGQQHGSVYSNDSEIIDDCPIWMDSSTEKQCKMIESEFGRDSLKNVTGSFAYHRFTGSQILKRRMLNKREQHAEFNKVQLVSNFCCSFLCDKDVPMDFADASGMNLFDLRTREFNENLLRICDINQSFIQPPINSNSIVGKCDKFGFKNADVITFTGDNPSALVGCGACQPGDVVMSLGTSDTLFVYLDKLPDNLMTTGEAHVFCNPVNEDHWMALTCYRNGSLAREKVRSESKKDDGGVYDWFEISDILLAKKSEKLDNFSIDLFEREINPALGPDFHKNRALGRKPIDVIVDSLVGQVIMRKVHMETLLGICPERLILTGGASANKGLLQLIANVFQCEVFTLVDSTEAAAIGGALRANFAKTGVWLVPELVKTADPVVELKSHYGEMQEVYKMLEKEWLGSK